MIKVVKFHCVNLISTPPNKSVMKVYYMKVELEIPKVFSFLQIVTAKDFAFGSLQNLQLLTSAD